MEFEQLSKKRRELKEKIAVNANSPEHGKLLTEYLIVNQQMIEAAHSEGKFHLLSNEYK